MSKRCRADRDFEMGPATEIMVNDLDDERTLDEEEALEGSEDSHNELSHLQKEGDMPLKDLLVMYGYKDPSCQDLNKTGNDGDDDEDDEEEEEEDEEDEDEEDDDPASYEPDLKQFYTEMVKNESNPSNSGNSTKRAIKTSDGNQAGENASNHAANCSGGGNSEVTSGGGPKGDEGANAPSGNSGGTNNSGGSTDGNGGVENSGNASGSGNGSNGGSGGGSGSSRLLRSVSRPQSEEEEDDCDYSPDEEEWKKTIMVGSDYQAAIPEGLCKYDDALPYENEDKMLWDPSNIPEEKTEDFLKTTQYLVLKGSSIRGSTTLPSGSHVRDDEQALYLLLQCGYNLAEAIRRRTMLFPSSESISLWSEEECHNFESGLRHYGKDFHLIQKNKVRTRSVGELVQFYYLWKKTERHDIFTYKTRLEKKKYALHPGITDYMDRFLEEQEGVRDRSSSPNVHCLLLYGDAKRQRTNAHVTNNEEAKNESWDGGACANPGSASAPSVPATDPLDTSATAAATAGATGHMDYTAHMIRDPPAKSNNADGNATPWSPTSTMPPSPSQQRGGPHQPNNNHLLSNTFTGNPVTSGNPEAVRSPENILPHLPP